MADRVVGDPAAARTALDASLAFLRESGILAGSFFDAHPVPDPVPQRSRSTPASTPR